MRSVVLALLTLPLAALAQDEVAETGLEIIEVPQVQLVIIGPTDLLYSLFGHATMLVIDDPEAPIEEARAYNFGVTSFKRPNYMRDFLGGRVEFWGEMEPYGVMLRRWTKRDRTVTRYPVLLDDGARRRLIGRLERDVTPEHKDYLYDTFRENCATRLRDYLDTYSAGAVYASMADVMTETSFRDDVRHAYSNLSALLIATELMPGVDLDRPRSAWDLTYRPAYLLERLQAVQLPDGPLLGEPIVDTVRKGPDPRDGMRQHGQLFYLLLSALLGLLGWFIADRGARARGITLAIVALITSVLGITLLLVALTTDWPEFQRNPAVFAYVPLDLALLWTAGRLLFTGETGPAPVARTWLKGRLVVALLLVALTPVLSALHGPIPPRVLAVALLFVALRCLDRPQADMWA